MAQGRRIIKEISVDDVEKRRYPGKHYVYIITVTWSDNDVSVIYRRYSKFFDFQVKLLDMFPKDAGKNEPADRIIPFLPGKIIFGRSHIRDVAMKRLDHINLYCRQLIQLPPLISECQHVLSFFTATTDDLLPPDHRKETKAPQISGKINITEPILLEQYQVISDYNKEGANEINLIAGETIDVVEKTETGWWFVSGDDGQGWIPSSYLELPGGQQDNRILETSSSTGHPYLSTKAYQPQQGDELALELGTMVEVIERNLDGWWLVRCKGKEGRVPGSYLSRTDTIRAKRIMDAMGRSTVDVVPNLSSISNLNVKSGGSTGGDVGGSTDHGRRVFQLPAPHSSHNPSPVNPVSPSPARRFDRKPPPLPGAKRPKITDLIKSNGRHGNNAPSGEESPLVYRKPPPPRRSTIKKMTSPRPVSPPVEPIYMTISDFQNQAGDGISFTQGREVEVMDKHDSGWWFVRIEGKDGWAPAAYIQKTQPHQAKTNDKKPPVNAINTATKPTAASNFTNKLQEKLFGKKTDASQSAAPSSSSSNTGQAESKLHSKPLPAVPMTTWSDDDWETESDKGEYMEMDDQPIYSNSDDRPSVLPPVPQKNFWTEGGMTDLAAKNKDRGPITTPRTKPALNMNNKPRLHSDKPQLPPKAQVPASKPVVPKVTTQNKPQLPNEKPVPAKPNKPVLPTKQTNFGNGGFITELSSRLPGNQRSTAEPQGAVVRPKLPAKGGVAKQQPKNIVSTPESGATNVKAMKNMFEGR